MPTHRLVSHTIRLPAPADACQRFFTPAGETLWVDGWQPRYLHPADGRTVEGMVFTTGSGDALTFWSLADYRSTPEPYARYTRVTPASRSAFVEVRCTPVGSSETDVEVRYSLTALTPQGEADLADFEEAPFVRMIEGWRERIEARLPALLAAHIP